MPLLLELLPPAFPARGSSLSLLPVVFPQPGQSCRRDGIVWFACLAWEGSVLSPRPTAPGLPSVSLLGSLVGFGGCEMSWGEVEGGGNPHCG